MMGLGDIKRVPRRGVGGGGGVGGLSGEARPGTRAVLSSPVRGGHPGRGGGVRAGLREGPGGTAGPSLWRRGGDVPGGGGGGLWGGGRGGRGGGRGTIPGGGAGGGGGGGAPAILIGSHLDTVPNAGRYD